MDDREDYGSVMEQKKLEWQKHLERLKPGQGGRQIRTEDDSINIAKAYGSGSFLKDITGYPNVPPAPEEGSSIIQDKLYRNHRVFAPWGVTDRDPMPSMFWSQYINQITHEQLVGNAVEVITVANVWTKTAAVRADPLNAGVAYITGSLPVTNPSAVAPVAGVPLGPGQEQVLPVRNLANIRVTSVLPAVRTCFFYIVDPDTSAKA